MSDDSKDLEYKKRMTVVTVATVLFFILSLPQVYELVDKVLPVLGQNGCPSVMGVAIHALVFFVLFFAVHHFELLV